MEDHYCAINNADDSEIKDVLILNNHLTESKINTFIPIYFFY